MKQTTATLIAGAFIGIGIASGMLLPWYADHQEKQEIKRKEVNAKRESVIKTAKANRVAEWQKRATVLKSEVYQKFLRSRASSPYIILIDNDKDGRFYCLWRGSGRSNGKELIRTAPNNIRDEFADALVAAWKNDKRIKAHNMAISYVSLVQGTNYNLPNGFRGSHLKCRGANIALYRANRQFPK
jgi:hypothetical protein